MRNQNDLCYRFEYSFTSSSIYNDPQHLVTRINGKIMEEEYSADAEIEKETEIGTFLIHQILAEVTRESEWRLLDAMDVDITLIEIGEQIFDWETEDLKEEIIEFYEGELWNNDYFILSELKLEQKYRGNNIGLRVIYDVLKRFSGSAKLFVLKAFPMQYSGNVNADNEAEFLRSTGQLVKYYAQLGFTQIPEMGELMFLNPALKNEMDVSF